MATDFTMEKLTIKIKPEQRSYNIYIGYNVLDEIAKNIANNKYGSKLAIITDSNVRKLFGEALHRRLIANRLDATLLDFSVGETSKNRNTKEMLENKLIDANFGRDSAIIALGGGVVTDLAGFIASTYMRGIPYIQIPTTVIAQCDSSIGGKVAVNAQGAKNIIGAFWQPNDIFMDLKMLEMLDVRNYNSGLIEVIKHGIIYDRNFFEFIEKNLDAILSRTSSNYAKIMVELMKRNCAIKNEIVLRDEREADLRKILNYGHTIGHALEALSDFSLLHGEAIAIGIAAEAFLSYRLGFCSEENYERQLRIIKGLGLSIKIPAKSRIDDIIKKASLDKKARENQPEFVLLEKIGKIKTFDSKRATRIDRDKLKILLEEFVQED